MMSTHATIMETNRLTKKTLYIVTALYVAVGFVAATASALSGDRLGTFLGFLMISGALGATALLRAVLRIEVRISAIGDAATEMHTRMGRLETELNETRDQLGLGGCSLGETGVMQLLDLAAMGGGNLDALTAATLDHKAYPRLSATIEEGSQEQREEDSTPSEGDTQKRCEPYPPLVEEARVEAIASLSEELAERVERSLREAFSSCVRKGDYAGGLAIGERIGKLLADRPVAAEFRRIRPYLLGRLNREATRSGPPLAASQ